MDVSDLPVPLSRIETLWNCLITGETPDFEPLSRNEKYLMAMLDRYDISNLPAPMSRGEKLLYKIAVGETDLSDVPGYLSRYEELLKYLIENGGIGGGDFEYVLYTLNQSLSTLYTTAEKTVKSAILKGQTLVNIVNNDNWVQGTGNDRNLFTQNISIKKGQTYTVIGKLESNDVIDESGDAPAFRIRTGTNSNDTSLLFIQQSDVVIKQTFTNNENDTIHLRFFNQKTNYKKLMIIEGDYTNVNIPYFEGMQSVKMPVLTTTGKNLFDETKILKRTWNAPFVNGNNFISPINGDNLCSSGRIKVEKGKVYVCSGNNITREVVTYYKTDDISEYPFDGIQANGNQFTSLYDGYIEWYLTNDNINNPVTGVQIEQGSTSTTYEPYKTNILTVNEDVTLRGVGKVKDELNVATGELTQRIGEIVLDGTTGISLGSKTSDAIVEALIYFDSSTPKKHDMSTNGISDKVITTTSHVDTMNYVRFNTRVTNYIIYGILSNQLETADVAGVKKYLQANPITVQYELATPIIKTVDLTVVDQDGNETKLRTFDDTTHVLLESEGLIPTASLTVRTKIPSASSTSLLMNDISTEQQQLETTVDEQSENVDATMIATTEIFEETL